MKSFFVFLLIHFSACAYCQVSSALPAEKLIVSSWILDSVRINGIIQPLTDANKKSKLIFYKDHHSESINEYGFSDKGSWQLKNGNKTLLIQTPDDSLKFEVLTLQKNRLVMSVINPNTKEPVITYLRNEND